MLFAAQDPSPPPARTGQVTQRPQARRLSASINHEPGISNKIEALAQWRCWQKYNAAPATNRARGVATHSSSLNAFKKEFKLALIES